MKLWANYFKINIKAPAVYRYTIKVAANEEALKKEAEVASKKVEVVIGHLLRQIGASAQSVAIASDFKVHLVTATKLPVPANRTFEVTWTEPSFNEQLPPKPQTWLVKVEETVEDCDFGKVLNELTTLDPTIDTLDFPKYNVELDALNTIITHHARAHDRTAVVGRGRFFAFGDDLMEQKLPTEASPVVILRGYFASVRPATGRLLLNTNVTHGVFRPGVPLKVLFKELGLAVMDQIKQLQPYQKSQIKARLTRVNKVLSKARVEVNLPFKATPDGKLQWKKAYRTIESLAKNNGSDFPYGGPGSFTFVLNAPAAKDGSKPPPPFPGLPYGKKIAVAEYYQTKYGIKADKSLPLVNVGTKEHAVYVFAEHCTLVRGRSVKTKLEPEEAQDMINFACRAPSENAESIVTKGRQTLGLDNTVTLGKFKVSIDKELLTVVGRELPPPKLAYTGSSVYPSNGSWNMRDIKVARPCRPIKRWSYLWIQDAVKQDAVKQNPSRNPPKEQTKEQVESSVASFADKLIKTGIPIGRKFQPGLTLPVNPHNSKGEEAFNASVQKLMAENEFLVVVLFKKDATIYSWVKRAADIKYGVHTVCVQISKFSPRDDDLKNQRGQPGYFANVGLKVNLKFGGTNHSVERPIKLLEQGKTMVVGYDVTHPTNQTAGQNISHAPSIVGLVSSIDRYLGQWPGVVWKNPRGQESMTAQFGDKFIMRLKLWRNNPANKGTLPDNILIFRDGVSEGQFQMVINQELPLIRTACEKVYPAGKKPRITLIVSVKRHQTRFFPTDPGHIHPVSKSPKEGTIVDRGVTNVRYWDFFLQAHASLQGTARSAHYTVLVDEIFRAEYKDKAANMLEELTHQMCYLFGRATKAVSICPPAYYADLVCDRARIHMKELFDAIEDDKSVKSGEFETLGASGLVHPRIADSMYYI